MWGVVCRVAPDQRGGALADAWARTHKTASLAGPRATPATRSLRLAVIANDANGAAGSKARSLFDVLRHERHERIGRSERIQLLVGALFQEEREVRGLSRGQPGTQTAGALYLRSGRI